MRSTQTDQAGERVAEVSASLPGTDSFQRASKYISRLDLGRSKSKTVLFLVTEDYFFCSHRLPLAYAAVADGWRVVVATRVREHGQMIADSGAEVVPLRLRRESWNPLNEFLAVREIAEIYRRVRPDIVHHVGMKPVVYGSIAARVTRMPAVVNAFAGMGYLETSADIKAALLRPMVRLAMRLGIPPHAQILLQNDDDAAMVRRAFPGHAGQITIIRGSGVDLKKFTPTPEPTAGAPFVVLPARMLRDKGVYEFVEAAQRLKESGVQARFVLVGGTDKANPAAVPEAQLKRWEAEGFVEWHGHRTDMDAILRQATIVCLPSYREGLPKSLLEAAASQRAIVTTDTPGCRDVVQHNVTGLLVPVKDATALVSAIGRLLSDPGLRQLLARNARQSAVELFDVDIIARQTIDLYDRLLAECL